MSPTAPRLLVLSMGDAAGIGPEIIARAYQEAPERMQGTVVFGDVACMRRAAAVWAQAAAAAPQAFPLPVAALNSLEEAWEVPPRCIPVWQVGAAITPPAWGQVSAVAGALAGQCAVDAANAALQGRVAAVVTAPLHKEALSAAGAPYDRFPGHTELLQHLAAEHRGVSLDAMPVRMMLANQELRTVLVSIHVSLRDAIAAVTLDNVLQTLLITHQALGVMLGRPPRIAVAGLNPHAGEGGLFGREELDTIIPAIAQARQQGCQVSGPWPPDSVFMRARHGAGHPGEFDVVVAMYHDQGLIPVKYLGVDQGVNVTLGLPLIRTSPDHGTAFDIAGTGQASAESLLEAVAMARTLAGRS